MEKIKIIADSACDLNQDVLDQYDVACLPLQVEIGGEEYRDRVEITPQKFYEKLSRSKAMPKTSQITPTEFHALFKTELEQRPDQALLYIAFASPLSGTYESACVAKRTLDDDARITIIDSQGASLGYGLMVLQAAKMAQEGQSLEQIAKRVRQMVDTMRYIFVVGDFELLKRGGRISAATAVVGDLFNIKLILNIIDGVILPLAKAHGVKKAHKKLLDIMEEHQVTSAQTVGISYAYDRQAAEQVQQMIAEKFKVPTVLTEIGAVIGAHVGAGTVAIFYEQPTPTKLND
jgi:DegV family protein with EDD domain